MEVALAGVVGAVAFRLRGDRILDEALHVGTSGGRLLWALAVALTVWLPGGDAAAGAWCGAGAFVGAVPGWGARIDMSGGLPNALRLGLRGLLWTAPIGVGLWLATGQGAWVAAVGAALPALYWRGWHLRVRRRAKGALSARRRWLQDAAASELLFGAWMLAWLAAAG